MDVVLEMLVALFAAFGIMCMMWCIFSGRSEKAPVFGDIGDVFAVIQCRGDGEKLQNAVNALQWLHKNGAEGLTLLIDEEGLDSNTRRIAENFALDDDNVCLCSLSEIFRI